MRVVQLIPDSRTVDLNELVNEIKKSEVSTLEPFSPLTIKFCAAFSRQLFRDSRAKQVPEIMALAYKMRKSELFRLKEQFFQMRSKGVLLTPRGMVFHIAPSNVDTIFLYSWLFSILCGNRNLIRISQKISETVHILLGVYSKLIREDRFSSLAANTFITSYGHQIEISSEFSNACDVRVIWGGNRTISEVRAIALPPGSKEIVFPERFSFAALDAFAFCELQLNKQEEILSGFFNDAYSFDQMGCSCPRLIVWVGDKKVCNKASDVFFELLKQEIERKDYRINIGTTLNKVTYAHQAVLHMPCENWVYMCNELCILRLSSLERFRRDQFGGGLFFEYFAETLGELVDFVDKKDQTMVYFGFDRDQLKEFLFELRGKGLDRVVPVGQALDFHRFWDGYDLLGEFSRITHLR